MTFTDIAELRIRVLGAEAEKSFEGLNASAKQVKQHLKEMELLGQKNTEEYRELQRVARDVATEFKNTTKSIDLQNASLNELNAYKKRINAELGKLTVGTQEWISKLGQLDTVNGRLNEIKNAMHPQPGLWDRMKESALGFIAAISFTEVISSIWQFARQGIKAAAELDDSFAKIMKTTGQTKAEVIAMNEELKKIDTRTAQSELLKIGEIGGQIGVVKDEMLGFVEATDMAVVALGDEFSGGAEEVTKKLAPLKTLFKETKDLDFGTALNQIGSGLNELGASGTATAPVVADFTARIGQLGDLSPEISQVMGLGASFQELGLTAEISSGGIANIMLTAAKDTEGFAKQLGITEKEFAKLIASSPNEMLLRLAESFKGMPIDKVIKEMDGMGIKSQEATKVMSLLKDQTDLVREKQELASKAMQEATSLTNEFNIMNNTSAAQLEKNQKALENKRVELGQKLLPVYILLTQIGVKFTEFLVNNSTAISVVSGITATYIGVKKLYVLWTERAIITETLSTLAMRANAAQTVILNGLTKIKNILIGESILARTALTGSTVVLTEAELAATVAARGFNATLMANPFLLVAGLIAALVAGYQLYSTEVEKATTQKNNLNKSVRDAQAGLMQEKASFNFLAKSILDVNEKTEVRKKHLEELKAKYPQQLSGISSLADAELKLASVIRQTNGDFATRAHLLKNEVYLKNNLKAADQAIQKQMELENKLKSGDTKTVQPSGMGFYTTIDHGPEIKAAIAAQDAIVKAALKANDNINEQSKRLMGSLKFNYETDTKNFAAGVSNNTEASKKGAKEQEKHIKDLEKARQESTDRMVKEAAEFYKKMSGLMEKNYKSQIKANDDTAKANEELKKRLEKQHENFQDYLDNSEKIKLIRNAKSIEEIEKIELEFAERKRKRQIQETEELVRKLKREFDLLKAAGLLHKDEELKRGAEIAAAEAKLYDLKSIELNKHLENVKKAKKEEAEENKRWIDKEWEATKTNVEKGIVLEKTNGELKKAIIQALLNEAYNITQSFFDKSEAQANLHYQNATTEVEKYYANAEKENIAYGRSLIDLAATAASGNLVGTITGVIGVLKNFVKSFSDETELAKARLRDLYTEVKKQSEAMAEQAKIAENVYGNLTKPDLPQWMKDLTKEIGDAFTINTIDTELKKGQSITDTYNLAVSKETEYTASRVKNIEDVYNKEVKRITDKYAHEDTLANQRYSADSLAIQSKTNEELLALITNLDSQASIQAEYNKKVSDIRRAFALADQEITAETDAATIEAINAAKAARDKALADVGQWYQAELKFTIENEGQKRREYTATEKIIKDGQEAMAALSIKHAAEDIARNLAKNIELAGAETKKNNDMQAEAKRHNDELVRLGVEKDAALAASFSRFKDLVNAGYEEMISNAERLYQKGIITAAQYEALINRANTLKYLANPTIPSVEAPSEAKPYIEPIVIPRFAEGTEYVDPKAEFGRGVDKVPALVNRGERIIPTSLNMLLPKISNTELVNRLLNSNMYRNGSNISTSKGIVNLAVPNQVHNMQQSNNISTAMLEAAMLAVKEQLAEQHKTLKQIAEKDASINYHSLKAAFGKDADISGRAAL